MYIKKSQAIMAESMANNLIGQDSTVVQYSHRQCCDISFDLNQHVTCTTVDDESKDCFGEYNLEPCIEVDCWAFEAETLACWIYNSAVITNEKWHHGDGTLDSKVLMQVHREVRDASLCEVVAAAKATNYTKKMLALCARHMQRLRRPSNIPYYVSSSHVHNPARVLVNLYPHQTYRGTQIT